MGSPGFVGGEPLLEFRGSIFENKNLFMELVAHGAVPKWERLCDPDHFSRASVFNRVVKYKAV
jgi:hypothetical protein